MLASCLCRPHRCHARPSSVLKCIAKEIPCPILCITGYLSEATPIRSTHSSRGSGETYIGVPWIWPQCASSETQRCCAWPMPPRPGPHQNMTLLSLPLLCCRRRAPARHRTPFRLITSRLLTGRLVEWATTPGQRRLRIPSGHRPRRPDRSRPSRARFLQGCTPSTVEGRGTSHVYRDCPGAVTQLACGTLLARSDALQQRRTDVVARLFAHLRPLHPLPGRRHLRASHPRTNRAAEPGRNDSPVGTGSNPRHALKRAMDGVPATADLAHLGPTDEPSKYRRIRNENTRQPALLSAAPRPSLPAIDAPMLAGDEYDRNTPEAG